MRSFNFLSSTNIDFIVLFSAIGVAKGDLNPQGFLNPT